MTELFLSVFNRGMEAGCLILAVIFARFLLKQAPKNIICILWLVVGLRLLCPVDIESAFSLLPSGQMGIQIQNMHTDEAADEKTLAESIDIRDKSNILNKNLIYKIERAKTSAANESFNAKGSALFMQGFQPKIINAAVYIWLAGLTIMSVYLAWSWKQVRKSVFMSVPAEFDGMAFYQCDRISSPFLFGILSPKIYVPFSVCGPELSYVLKHERAHKSRADHRTKFIAYLLLACYWFHPLVWAAYILFCRDIELACDERVVRELGSSCKTAYSKALLTCAVEQKNKSIAACPVAFGEIGVKDRVKNILRYKKPAFCTLLAAGAVCVVITAGFATKPKNTEAKNMEPDGTQMEDRNVESDGEQMEDRNVKSDGDRMEDRNVKSDGEQMEDRNVESDGDRMEEKNSTETENDGDFLENESDELALVENVTKWAEVFCSRNGAEAGKMLTDDLKQNLMDGGQSFGWSSPWPWNDGIDGDEPDYRILSVDSSSAVILFYAWTSDPHVTVWRQVITYTGSKDDFLIDSTSTSYFDEISTAEEFYQAYPDGIIKDTRMDYVKNGTYETLNRNAILSSTNIYRALSKPEKAAVSLLNLTSEVSTDVSVRDGRTFVTVVFAKDQSEVTVEMVQPNGEYGIWIPQT